MLLLYYELVEIEILTTFANVQAVTLVGLLVVLGRDDTYLVIAAHFLIKF